MLVFALALIKLLSFTSSSGKEINNRNEVCYDLLTTELYDHHNEHVWQVLDSDVELRPYLTRWRKYHYGLKIDIRTLLVLCGDISINPGPSK